MSDRRKIGAGWNKTTRDGKKLISIIIEADIEAGARLVGWITDDKGGNERRPDVTFYVDEWKPPVPPPAEEFPEDDEPEDDVVPF